MKISLFSVAFSLSAVSSVSARRKKTEDDPAQVLEKQFSRVLGGARHEQKKVARHLKGGRGVSLTLSVNLKRFGVCCVCFLVFSSSLRYSSVHAARLFNRNAKSVTNSTNITPMTRARMTFTMH
jgi:hypothetical protein